MNIRILTLKGLAMFGLGKKRLTDKLSNYIMFNVGMLQSWSLNNTQNLNPEELSEIITKILKKENVSYTNIDVSMLRLQAIGNVDPSSFDMWAKFRADTKFDESIVQFCKNLDLQPSFYTRQR